MSRVLKKIITILGLLVSFSGCGGLEESEKEKLRRANMVAERIYRGHDEERYRIEPSRQRVREAYPWEEKN